MPHLASPSPTPLKQPPSAPPPRPPSSPTMVANTENNLSSASQEVAEESSALSVAGVGSPARRGVVIQNSVIEAPSGRLWIDSQPLSYESIKWFNSYFLAILREGEPGRAYLRSILVEEPFPFYDCPLPNFGAYEGLILSLIISHFPETFQNIAIPEVLLQFSNPRAICALYKFFFAFAKDAYGNSENEQTQLDLKKDGWNAVLLEPPYWHAFDQPKTGVDQGTSWEEAIPPVSKIENKPMSAVLQNSTRTTSTHSSHRDGLSSSARSVSAPLTRDLTPGSGIMSGSYGHNHYSLYPRSQNSDFLHKHKQFRGGLSRTPRYGKSLLQKRHKTLGNRSRTVKPIRNSTNKENNEPGRVALRDITHLTCPVSNDIAEGENSWGNYGAISNKIRSLTEASPFPNDANKSPGGEENIQRGQVTSSDFSLPSNLARQTPGTTKREIFVNSLSYEAWEDHQQGLQRIGAAARFEGSSNGPFTIGNIGPSPSEEILAPQNSGEDAIHQEYTYMRIGGDGMYGGSSSSTSRFSRRGEFARLQSNGLGRHVAPTASNADGIRTTGGRNSLPKLNYPVSNGGLLTLSIEPNGISATVVNDSENVLQPQQLLPDIRDIFDTRLCAVCHEDWIWETWSFEELMVMDRSNAEWTLVRLPCGHWYHQACLAVWFAEGSAVCPCCRRKYELPNDNWVTGLMENGKTIRDLWPYSRLGDDNFNFSEGAFRSGIPHYPSISRSVTSSYHTAQPSDRIYSEGSGRNISWTTSAATGGTTGTVIRNQKQNKSLFQDWRNSGDVRVFLRARGQKRIPSWVRGVNGEVPLTQRDREFLERGNWDSRKFGEGISNRSGVILELRANLERPGDVEQTGQKGFGGLLLDGASRTASGGSEMPSEPLPTILEDKNSPDNSSLVRDTETYSDFAALQELRDILISLENTLGEPMNLPFMLGDFLWRSVRTGSEHFEAIVEAGQRILALGLRTDVAINSELERARAVWTGIQSRARSRAIESSRETFRSKWAARLVEESNTARKILKRGGAIDQRRFCASALHTTRISGSGQGSGLTNTGLVRHLNVTDMEASKQLESSLDTWIQSLDLNRKPLRINMCQDDNITERRSSGSVTASDRSRFEAGLELCRYPKSKLSALAPSFVPTRLYLRGSKEVSRRLDGGPSRGQDDMLQSSLKATVPSDRSTISSLSPTPQSIPHPQPRKSRLLETGKNFEKMQTERQGYDLPGGSKFKGTASQQISHLSLPTTQIDRESKVGSPQTLGENLDGDKTPGLTSDTTCFSVPSKRLLEAAVPFHPHLPTISLGPSTPQRTKPPPSPSLKNLGKGSLESTSLGRRPKVSKLPRLIKIVRHTTSDENEKGKEKEANTQKSLSRTIKSKIPVVVSSRNILSQQQQQQKNSVQNDRTMVSSASTAEKEKKNPSEMRSKKVLKVGNDTTWKVPTR